MARHLLHEFGAIFVVWFALAALSSADENTPPFRLPSDVAAPVRYAVDLTLVPDQDAFSGSSAIEIDFKKQTSSLWLNANNLLRDGILPRS